MTNMNKVVREMRENSIKREQETKEINEKILQVPKNLSEIEKDAYKEIIQSLKDSIFIDCHLQIQNSFGNIVKLKL